MFGVDIYFHILTGYKCGVLRGQGVVVCRHPVWMGSHAVPVACVGGES